MIKQRLRRPCTYCGDKFKPTGRSERLCAKCFTKAHKKAGGYKRRKTIKVLGGNSRWLYGDRVK